MSETRGANPEWIWVLLTGDVGKAENTFVSAFSTKKKAVKASGKLRDWNEEQKYGMWKASEGETYVLWRWYNVA